MTETNLTKLDEQIEVLLDRIANENDEVKKDKLINQLVKLVELDLKNCDTYNQSYKNEELIKVEKRKVIIDNLTKLLGAGLSFGGTILAIIADKNGWFVSRLGLQVGKKLL